MKSRMQDQNQQMNLVNLRILWFGLLSSHFLYAFGLYVRFDRPNTLAVSSNPLLIPIFSALGIVMLFIAIFLTRYQFDKEKNKLLEKNGPVDFRNIKLEKLISIFANPFILRHSLFQSIALLGFALAITQANIAFYYPFALVSVVAYLINFPTEVKIRNAFLSNGFINNGTINENTGLQLKSSFPQTLTGKLQERKIISQYPYRSKPLLVVGAFVFFVTGGVWMMYLPFSNTCSKDKTSIYYCSEVMETFFTYFMISIGLLCILCFVIVLISFIRSRKNPFRKKVAFTEHSIIGQTFGGWDGREIEILFSEINGLNLIINQQGKRIVVTSDNNSIVIEQKFLEQEYFIEIYNVLAKTCDRPSHEEVIAPIQARAKDEKGLVLPLLYMIFPIILLVSFESNYSMQIGHDGLIIGVLILNVGLLFLVIKGNKKLKTNFGHKTKVGIYILLTLGFLVGVFGNMSLISFLNQLGDNSPIETQISNVVEDGGQSDESLKKDGKCYDLIDIKDPTTTFGMGDLCERTHPGIAQKKVEVIFKKGNFSQRWAVEYKVVE